MTEQVWNWLEDEASISEQAWKLLEDEASIYINLSKLTGEKFQINADMTGDDVDHNGLVGQHLLTQ